MALSTIFTVFAVLIVLAISCEWSVSEFRRRRFRLRHHCEAIPRGCRDQFLGIDCLVKLKAASKEKRYLLFSRENFDRYGTTYICKLLRRTVVCSASPQNFKAVLSTQFADFDAGRRRAKAFEPLFGTDSVFTTDGHPWKQARSVLRPGLTQTHAIDFDALEVHWKRLLNNIPKDGSTMDLQELFFRFTMDSTTQFLFGKPLGCLEKAIKPCELVEFVHSFETALSDAYQRAVLGSLRFLDRNYSAVAEQHHSAKTREFVNGMITKAIAKSNGNKASALEPDTAKHKFLFETLMHTMSPSAMQDQIMATFMAARDTTAIFLSQLWFEVSRRPEIFSKMKNEVDCVLNGQLPTSDSIKRLTYIDQVMKETLRLWPPLPTTVRVANKDTTLPCGGGPTGNSPVFIRKGTEVLLAIHALHRNKEIWGNNANDFVPERWSTTDPKWSFLPFLGGPRICPGQRRSLAECAYITVRLLQTISRIESRDDRPYEEFLKITVENANGLLVGLYVE